MIKILELFGGIGACSKALERLGIDYEIADYVEIDKYAVASFNAIHNTNYEPQDICNWNKDIEVDLIMHGSPCQDFSIIGQQAGGDKNSGTRSSLMYETIRIVKKLRPKYVIWENVKNLLSANHKHNFDTYLETMEQLGYTNYYQVLNAKDYGIPQNRERVFTISIQNIELLGETEDCFIPITNFKFPKPRELKFKINELLEEVVDDDHYVNEYFLNQMRNTNFRKDNYKENTFKLANGTYNEFAIADYRYDEGLRIRKNNLCPTLTTRGKQSLSGVPIIYKDKTMRFITSKECWRLMGFDDTDFEKAAKVNSNTQLYKQAGNSIVVNVLEAILTNLLLNNEQTTNPDVIEGQTNIFDFI